MISPSYSAAALRAASPSPLSISVLLSAISMILPFSKTESIPSNITTKPLPPASTTPAFFRVGSRFGVSSRATFAPSNAALNTVRASPPALKDFFASSDATLATVRMVPSVGFITALYAASTPASNANTRFSAVTSSLVPIPFEIPRNSRDVITPELPRAPRSKAEAAILAISPAFLPACFESSLAALPILIDILVPVSPSGTGNTLSSSTRCLSLKILFEPEIIASRRISPENKINTP